MIVNVKSLYAKTTKLTAIKKTRRQYSTIWIDKMPTRCRSRFSCPILMQSTCRSFQRCTRCLLRQTVIRLTFKNVFLWKLSKTCCTPNFLIRRWTLTSWIRHRIVILLIRRITPHPKHRSLRVSINLQDRWSVYGERWTKLNTANRLTKKASDTLVV